MEHDKFVSYNLLVSVSVLRNTSFSTEGRVAVGSFNWSSLHAGYKEMKKCIKKNSELERNWKKKKKTALGRSFGKEKKTRYASWLGPYKANHQTNLRWPKLNFYEESWFSILKHSLLLLTSLSKFFYKKCVLKNFPKFTGKHLCRSLFFNKDFIKKETPTQVFSREFWEISKNPFLQNTSRWLLLSIFKITIRSPYHNPCF